MPDAPPDLAAGLTTSAPGKLVLAGEYAVLLGHPAVVTAVGVRAVARRRSGETRFPRDAGGLIDACVGALRDEGSAPAPGGYTVDTDAFRDAGRKLGLGSSSAACVAFLAAAIASPSAGLDPTRLHALAQAAHHTFSGGRGSGIDVAAAVFGGTCVFSRSTGGVPRTADLPATPDGLRVLVVFTGRSQDTRQYVARVLALSDPAAAVAPLGHAARAFAAAWERGEAEDVLRAVRATAHAMEDLGRRAGIDIVSEPHGRLVALANHLGGAAKPSGAGGGDVGLIFVPAEAEGAAHAAVRHAGLEIVDVELGAPGARVDPV
jgi:mevalonate kinase